MLSAHKTGNMGDSGWRLATESSVRPTFIVVTARGFDEYFGFL
jgi:hypothetical protein